MEHTTSQPSKRSGRKSHQISKTSLRRFIKEPNLHRGTVENVSGRSNLFDQWIVLYCIYGRPLYPSSVEIWETSPVTPNDLLIGRHFPPPVPEPEQRVNPRYLMRSTAKRVQEFWNCWMKYLSPNLLPRNKWFKKRENLQEGDLVLVIEPTTRRTWKMGLVIQTYPGQDGLTRKARIKTATSVYDRPIHKLCSIATKQELN